MARRARFSDFDGVITEEMLSDRQRAILDFIREHVYAKGYPPAVYLQVPAYTLICIN